MTDPSESLATWRKQPKAYHTVKARKVRSATGARRHFRRDGLPPKIPIGRKEADGTIAMICFLNSNGARVHQWRVVPP